MVAILALEVLLDIVVVGNNVEVVVDKVTLLVVSSGVVFSLRTTSYGLILLE